MPHGTHRPQKWDQIDLDDTTPVVVRPLEHLEDRRNNPTDIEPDRLAMEAGMERPSARPERLVFDILFTPGQTDCLRPPRLLVADVSALSCRRSAAAGAPRRADSAADTV
jgi:hypothetical protein